MREISLRLLDRRLHKLSQDETVPVLRTNGLACCRCSRRITAQALQEGAEWRALVTKFGSGAQYWCLVHGTRGQTALERTRRKAILVKIVW